MTDFPFDEIVLEFGEPQAWVTLVTTTDVPIDGYSWRTSGYLSALRKMQHTLVENGYDPESGVWRTYEFDASKARLMGLVEEGEVFDRIIVIVAKDVVPVVS